MQSGSDPTSTQQGENERLGSSTRETAEQLKQTARQGVEQAKSMGKEQLESGKQAAAEQTERLADVIDSAGRELDSRGEQSLASYASTLASTLDSFAGKLRSKSVDELTAEAQALARRNPTLFLAASVGIGFAVARFLKASPQNAQIDRQADREAFADEDELSDASVAARNESREDFSTEGL